MQASNTDFLKMKQTENLANHDIHLLLVLARLICISEGKSTLDMHHWKQACDLECQRKSRFYTSSK